MFKQTIKTFGLASLLVMLAQSTYAQAAEWCHASLRATDGTELQLDYQVRRHGLNHSPDVFVMANLYVHVKNEAFDGSEDVSIVLMNPRNGSAPESSQILNTLSFDGQRFTGKARDLENGRYEPYIKYDFPGYSSFHLEIAVVVNGKWLKDPISGESNFKFFAERYQDMCANPH